MSETVRRKVPSSSVRFLIEYPSNHWVLQLIQAVFRAPGISPVN